MAKVLNPAGSNEARGSIGGIIFNNHRGSNVVRCKKAPVKSKTINQNKATSLFSDISKSWQLLTNHQREAWNTFANTHRTTDWTGNNKKLSGYNSYCAHSYVASMLTPTLFYVTNPPSPLTAPTLEGQWSFNPFILNYEFTDDVGSFFYTEIRFRINCKYGVAYSLKDMNNTKIQLLTNDPIFLITDTYNFEKVILFYRHIKRSTGQVGIWYVTEFST